MSKMATISLDLSDITILEITTARQPGETTAQKDHVIELQVTRVQS
jgi:hypothetical protein